MDGDKVKLQFNIDDDKDERNAYSYPFAVPYTANGNTGWFFMPTPGEHAFLYIPSKDERKAYITKMNPLDETVNGIKNNPATRYLGTPDNKFVIILPIGDYYQFSSSYENIKSSMKQESSVWKYILGNN